MMRDDRKKHAEHRAVEARGKKGKMQCNAMNAMRIYAIQCNAMQRNAMPYIAVQCNAMQLLPLNMDLLMPPQPECTLSCFNALR